MTDIFHADAETNVYPVSRYFISSSLFYAHIYIMLGYRRFQLR